MNRSNPEPTFIQLETSLARIDERRELTTPGQQRRCPNYQANVATMRHTNGPLSNRPSNQRRPFVSRSNESRPRYPDQNSLYRSPRNAGSSTSYCTHCNRSGHSFVECRTRLRNSSGQRPVQTTSRPPPNQNRFRKASENMPVQRGEQSRSRDAIRPTPTSTQSTTRGPYAIQVAKWGITPVIAKVEHESATQITTEEQIMHKTRKKTEIIKTRTVETATTVHYCYKDETRQYKTSNN
jgi:hypothetical protein